MGCLNIRLECFLAVFRSLRRSMAAAVQKANGMGGSFHRNMQHRFEYHDLTEFRMIEIRPGLLGPLS